MEECAALPGYDISKYFDRAGELKDVKSRDLIAYIKEVIRYEFTAKDFRIWAGTLVTAVKIAEFGATEDLNVAEKNVLAAVDAVGARLGYTHAIAGASYGSPGVIEHYSEGSVIVYYSDYIDELIVAE